LYLPGFLDQNRPANPSVVKAWPKLFSRFPDCGLKDELAGEIAFVLSELPENFKVWNPNNSDTVIAQSRHGVETVTRQSRHSVDISSSSSSSIQKQKQQQEQKQEKEKKNLCASQKKESSWTDEPEELHSSSEKKEKQNMAANGANGSTTITDADIPQDDGDFDFTNLGNDIFGKRE